MKINAHLTLLLMVHALSSSFALQAMDTTYLTPSFHFPKPRFNRENLTSFDGYVALTKSAQYFNQVGKKTNFQPLGAQSLFYRFVNSTLSANDNTSIDNAMICWDQSSIKYYGNWTQNLGSHFFMTLAATGVDLKINSHNLIIAKNRAPFIDQTSELSMYIKKLLNDLQIAPSNNYKKSLIFQKNIAGPMYTTCGYTTSWMDFTHIDFIDLTIQAGFLLSGSGIEYIGSSPALIFNPYDTTNIGFPIQVNAAIGLYDWLNVGATVLCIPFASAYQKIGIFNAGSNNRLIADSIGWGMIEKDPFLYINGYLEADQMIPYTTILCGVSFVKQNNLQVYPSVQSLSYCLPEWEICNLNISIDIDLTKNINGYLPHIKLGFIHALAGKNAPANNLYGLQCGLDIIYTF